MILLQSLLFLFVAIFIGIHNGPTNMVVGLVFMKFICYFISSGKSAVLHVQCVKLHWMENELFQYFRTENHPKIPGFCCFHGQNEYSSSASSSEIGTPKCRIFLGTFSFRKRIHFLGRIWNVSSCGISFCSHLLISQGSPPQRLNDRQMAQNLLISRISLLLGLLVMILVIFFD